MKEDDFYRQILAVRMRVAMLYQRARDSLEQQQKLLVQGCEELYVALENLEVAAVELHQHSEALAAARDLVEVERMRYLGCDKQRNNKPE